MRVPWIRVHARLYDKNVVDRLCPALKVREHEAMGILVAFWSGVAEHAPNGHIAAATDAQLAKWARLIGKRGQRFAQWVRSEHMEPDGRVPEWEDYAGELEYQRERNRINQQNYRERRRDRLQDLRQSKQEISGQTADRNGDISGTSPTTVRYGTRRDGTGEVQQPLKPSRRRAKQPRESSGAESPSWVIAATNRWRELIGDVDEGRIGKRLKRLVDQYELPVVIAAIQAYSEEPMGTRPRTPEDFAGNFQRWRRESEIPLVHEGVITPRGERLTAPGKLA